VSWEDQDGGFGGEEESDGHLAAILLDPVGVSRRRWIPMLLCGAVGLLVTAVAVIVWEPIYYGSATVLISRQEIPSDFVRSTVQDDSLSNIDAVMGQVLSVEKVAGMIDRLGLFPDAKNVETEVLVGRVRANVDSGPVRRPSRGAASIVYQLGYSSSDPEEAAAVANGLAELFVEANTARRNSQARRATEFLREALEGDEAELREIAGRISDFRRAHRGELPSELPSNLRKLDGLSAQIVSLNNQITTKEDRILALTSHGGDSVLSENEILLGELRRGLARETAAHTEEHPNVIALRERIKRLESEVGSGGGQSIGSRRIIESERRDIARLQGLIFRAESESAALNHRIDRTPIVAEEFNALLQREQVLREDYLDSMRKVEDAELAENLESAQQGGQVTILDTAYPPGSPEVPRWLVALGGVGISAGLALAVAFLLELIDPVVLGVRQIQKYNPSPVLGSLPYVS
jgi:uncharacterized protein involved in exopolysaccharide biosynthesis